MSDETLAFTVTRSKADYFWAIAYNSLKSPIIPLFFAGALIVVVITHWAREGAFGAESVWIVAAIYGALIGLYYVALISSVWFVAAKNWKEPGASAPIRYAMSDAGIDVSYALGHGVLDWALWKSAFETGSLIVIRHNLGMVHIIPKRDLDKSTLTRLRAMLRERLGPKAKLKGEGAAP